MNLAIFAEIIPIDNIRVLKRRKIKENNNRDEIINISMKIALYFFAQKILCSWIKEREFSNILNPKITNVNILVRLLYNPSERFKKEYPKHTNVIVKEENKNILEFFKSCFNVLFFIISAFLFERI